MALTALIKIEQHEAGCNQRYEGIEGKIDDLSRAFDTARTDALNRAWWIIGLLLAAIASLLTLIYQGIAPGERRVDQSQHEKHLDHRQ